MGSGVLVVVLGKGVEGGEAAEVAILHGLDVLPLVLQPGPGLLELALGDPRQEVEYDRVHELFLPILLGANILLQALLVAVLHRLPFLVPLSEVFVQLLHQQLHLLQQVLAGDLYLSVKILCQLQGMPGALLVLDLKC